MKAVRKNKEMKKLIVITCAIAFAGIAQAAKVGWGYGGTISNTDAKESAYMFFIIGQGTPTDYLVESESQIVNLIKTKSSDLSKYAYGSGATGANGNVNVSTSSSGKEISVTETTTFEAFMVVFDNANVNQATKFIVIGNDDCGTANGYKKSISATSTSLNFAAGNVAAYVNSTANWQSIPEPTSGLLMLLGVAGLALRRRRA